MNNDFVKFQKYFKRYQQRFGLTGYSVYFEYKPLVGVFADIAISHGVLVATVALNNNLPDKDKPFKNIEQDAKHEALHLLLGRLEGNAKYRHASEAEIDESVEELVIKLEGLIGG